MHWNIYGLLTDKTDCQLHGYTYTYATTGLL